jgi:hypothetical protein
MSIVRTCVRILIEIAKCTVGSFMVWSPYCGAENKRSLCSGQRLKTMAVATLDLLLLLFFIVLFQRSSNEYCGRHLDVVRSLWARLIFIMGRAVLIVPFELGY